MAVRYKRWANRGVHRYRPGWALLFRIRRYRRETPEVEEAYETAAKVCEQQAEALNKAPVSSRDTLYRYESAALHLKGCANDIRSLSSSASGKSTVCEYCRKPIVGSGRFCSEACGNASDAEL
jgi:hypothetical protein